MMIQRTRKQTTKLILGTPILGMAILGTAFPWCVRLSSNIPGFVSVDIIGENNQVILEFNIWRQWAAEWATQWAAHNFQVWK